MSRKQEKSDKLVRKTAATPAVTTDLLGDVRTLIEAARTATAHAVNSAMVLLNWSIGDRIRGEVLNISGNWPITGWCAA